MVILRLGTFSETSLRLFFPRTFYFNILLHCFFCKSTLREIAPDVNANPKKFTELKQVLVKNSGWDETYKILIVNGV